MKTIARILGEAEVRPPTEEELTDPYWAYFYAKYIIKGRWPKGEETIAKDPKWAYFYAEVVIRGRWPEAEKIIANSRWAYRYARDVIGGRWPEGEETIAKDPEWAYTYAKYVIGGRWPEAEETIAKSEYKNQYLKAFPDAIDDWALLGWTDWMDVP